MSQLSSAYGGQTHNEQIGRGQPGFTQGFADFFTGEGYYADPRGTYLDGGWNISDKPIQTLGPRFGGTLDPYGNMGSAYGKPTSQPGRPNVLPNFEFNDIHDKGLLPGAPSGAQLGLPQQQVQPQIGAGLTGLAAYQQNKGAGI